MGLFRRKAAADLSAVLFYVKSDARRANSLVARLRDRGVSIAPCAVGTDTLSLAEAERKVRAATCIVVAWGGESPGRDVLREIAERAKVRGALIAIAFVQADQPLGFSNTPALDLSGARMKPAVIDKLASACADKLNATLPRRRRIWFRIGAVFTSLFSVTIAITGFDLLNAQEQFCRIPNLQPGISDFCGFAGMGDRPTREERLAWEKWDRRSCSALEQHIRAFPEGKFLGSATALLATRAPVATGRRVAAKYNLPLYVGVDGVLDGNEAASKQRALKRGEATSRRQCGLYAIERRGTLVSATPAVERWQCLDGACSLEGHSNCVVNQPEWEDVCVSEAQ